MTIIRPANLEDLPEILAIYNEAVLNTTAIWMDTPVDLDNRASWYESRISAGYPVIVAGERGGVLGYATYGPFRPFEGYRATAELSVYVNAAARGQGLGRKLLQALIDEAVRAGLHMLVAGIEGGNVASIRLHASLGFSETGRMPEVGQKFGRFLDLVLMQKRLT
ncbi:N-acyltransferase YncA [Hartmannibacter diazotrophicus]|uniref:N-acyltransferase YncA n=1 Tax=Hartmannibacter diazotrophicus TaxID=1482074 RepID=A0A2C9D1L1_9HYPH|nr:N-acyltransferase YncA [Hartmannibacter diazotrophicus]